MRVTLKRPYTLPDGRIREAGRVLDITRDKYEEMKKQGYFSEPKKKEDKGLMDEIKNLKI
jgi:hypothetical protein